jgi:hypothetical protein
MHLLELPSDLFVVESTAFKIEDNSAALMKLDCNIY